MDTLRFGIIGTENSHAVQACKRFNVDKSILDTQVAALCPGPGDTLAHCREVAQGGLVPMVVEKFEQMLDLVDAVIIMNRHGKYHTPSARLSLSRNIATFVDKPLTCSVPEAQELIDLAHKTNTWLSSWSTLWHTAGFTSFIADAKRDLGTLHIGMAGGPCELDSEYGGVFFYGIHTVEMALQGFGYDVAAVTAAHSAQGAVATLTLDSGMLVNLHLIKPYVFQALVHGEKGSRYQVIDSSDGYDKGFQAMVDGIRSGKRPLSDEQLLMPVQVLTALEKALATGTTIHI
ncbi:MAG: Gfo/Idh/MocA family oxidoreductase [Chloroflexi bacterium]|nr:Gfo/Idh/MocA family oxidoreductase [Chloroflexota bacterium]